MRNRLGGAVTADAVAPYFALDPDVFLHLGVPVIAGTRRYEEWLRARTRLLVGIAQFLAGIDDLGEVALVIHPVTIEELHYFIALGGIHIDDHGVVAEAFDLAADEDFARAHILPDLGRAIAED